MGRRSHELLTLEPLLQSLGLDFPFTNHLPVSTMLEHGRVQVQAEPLTSGLSPQGWRDPLAPQGEEPCLVRCACLHTVVSRSPRPGVA